MNTDTQPRSIWGNINFIVTGVADALGASAQACSKVAQTAESLADTAKVMADNNKEIVTIKSNYDKEIELKKLDNLINNSIADNL